VISFPPGVYRGFRNVGDSHAILMAIIGSKAETQDGGRVAWAPQILEQSAADRAGGIGIGRSDGTAQGLIGAAIRRRQRRIILFIAC
jgi:hypothetical protein